MRNIKTVFLAACISSALLACKKDSQSGNCELLKNALIADVKDDVKALVNTYISQTPSQVYTAQNMDALASALSKECSLSPLVLCFDCVFTLPSMSEIQITVTSIQPNVSRVLDISYTPDNKMTCVSVHD